MTGPTNHLCDYPGCTAWGLRGFNAPHDQVRTKRNLWACPEHVSWARERWRQKFNIREV